MCFLMFIPADILFNLWMEREEMNLKLLKSNSSCCCGGQRWQRKCYSTLTKQQPQTGIRVEKSVIQPKNEIQIREGTCMHMSKRACRRCGLPLFIKYGVLLAGDQTERFYTHHTGQLLSYPWMIHMYRVRPSRSIQCTASDTSVKWPTSDPFNIAWYHWRMRT